MSGHTSAEQDSAFAEMSTEDGANSGRGNVWPVGKQIESRILQYHT